MYANQKNPVYLHNNRRELIPSPEWLPKAAPILIPQRPVRRPGWGFPRARQVTGGQCFREGRVPGHLGQGEMPPDAHLPSSWIQCCFPKAPHQGSGERKEGAEGGALSHSPRGLPLSLSFPTCQMGKVIHLPYKVVSRGH